MENPYHKLRVYDGEGATGPVLHAHTGAGFIDFTGQPGQSLTVRFNSDGSNFMSGFNIAADYIWGCSVSIVENTLGRWALFPNPSNGNFTITGTTPSGTVNITVFDMQGRPIEHIASRATDHISMNLAGHGTLVPGCYVLRISTEQGQDDRLVVIE